MRKFARELVYQNLFSYLFLKTPDGDTLNALLNGAEELTDSDKEYAIKLYNLAVENYDNTINEIAAVTKDYGVERIFKADLCALILALTEIKHLPEIPKITAVDEAVALVKKYSTENSTGFVNGLLAEFVK